MSETENVHAGHRERMMKRLVENSDNLLDHELLEIILFATLPRVNTNPIAHKLLKVFGSLSGVFTATVEELLAINGVGKRTAEHLRAVGLIFRKSGVDNGVLASLKNFEMVKEEAIRLFKEEKEERMCLFLLNSVYKRVAIIDFFDEREYSVSVEVPNIAKVFAIYKPKHVIIAHNHPSGLPEPSEKDDNATMKINLLCSAHGANLADHVVYAKGEVYSYNKSGKLEEIKKKSDLNKLLNNLQ